LAEKNQEDFHQVQDMWQDEPEDAESLRKIQSHHQALIQQQKMRNWVDVMGLMFPAYLHLKKKNPKLVLGLRLGQLLKGPVQMNSRQEELERG
jgi:hypothetical protein